MTAIVLLLLLAIQCGGGQNHQQPIDVQLDNRRAILQQSQQGLNDVQKANKAPVWPKRQWLLHAQNKSDERDRSRGGHPPPLDTLDGIHTVSIVGEVWPHACDDHVS